MQNTRCFLYHKIISPSEVQKHPCSFRRRICLFFVQFFYTFDVCFELFFFPHRVKTCPDIRGIQCSTKSAVPEFISVCDRLSGCVRQFDLSACLEKTDTAEHFPISCFQQRFVFYAVPFDIIFKSNIQKSVPFILFSVTEQCGRLYETVPAVNTIP